MPDEKSFLPKIERLGEEVETLWKKERYAKEVFPRVACEALQRQRPHENFTMEGFLQWLRKTKRLPAQLSLHNGFGQPPITLYRNDPLNFLIDLYVWVTPEIAIHSHGFRGAFTVLQGKSLHCQYDFPVTENEDDQVLIGELLLKEAVLLTAGEIKEVPQGLKFIHEVWHISFPTISLVIRTQKWDGLQYTCLKPRFAFRYRDYTPLETKQMDTLLMLHRTHSPQEERFLEELVSIAEPYVGFMHLKKYFEETGELKRVRKILERVPRLKKWADPFLQSLEYLLETRVVWEHIQEEGERLFLALLTSSMERGQILRFVGTHYPGQSPLTACLAWLKELVRGKKLAFTLNETAFDVLELLLYGYKEKKILQKLSQEYEIKNRILFQRQIHTFCDTLRSTQLLKPLLPLPQDPSLKT